MNFIKEIASVFETNGGAITSNGATAKGSRRRIKQSKDNVLKCSGELESSVHCLVSSCFKRRCLIRKSSQIEATAVSM